jgi:hypothetical protein
MNAPPATAGRYSFERTELNEKISIALWKTDTELF